MWPYVETGPRRSIRSDELTLGSGALRVQRDCSQKRRHRGREKATWRPEQSLQRCACNAMTAGTPRSWKSQGRLLPLSGPRKYGHDGTLISSWDCQRSERVNFCSFKAPVREGSPRILIHGLSLKCSFPRKQSPGNRVNFRPGWPSLRTHHHSGARRLQEVPTQITALHACPPRPATARVSSPPGHCTRVLPARPAVSAACVLLPGAIHPSHLRASGQKDSKAQGDPR